MISPPTTEEVSPPPAPSSTSALDDQLEAELDPFTMGSVSQPSSAAPPAATTASPPLTSTPLQLFNYIGTLEKDWREANVRERRERRDQLQREIVNIRIEIRQLAALGGGVGTIARLTDKLERLQRTIQSDVLPPPLPGTTTPGTTKRKGWRGGKMRKRTLKKHQEVNKRKNVRRTRRRKNRSNRTYKNTR